MNETERPAAEGPSSAPEETNPAWPHHQHSGEGSASALASLRKLEDSRKQPERPADADEATPEQPS